MADTKQTKQDAKRKRGRRDARRKHRIQTGRTKQSVSLDAKISPEPLHIKPESHRIMSCCSLEQRQFGCRSQKQVRALCEQSTISLFRGIINTETVGSENECVVNAAVSFFVQEGKQLRSAEFRSPLMKTFMQTRTIPVLTRQYLHVAWCILQDIFPSEIGILTASFLEWREWKGPFTSSAMYLWNIGLHYRYDPRYDCFIPIDCKMKKNITLDGRASFDGAFMYPVSSLLESQWAGFTHCHDGKATYFTRQPDPFDIKYSSTTITNRMSYLYMEPTNSGQEDYLTTFAAERRPIVCVYREGESLLVFHSNDDSTLALVFSLQDRFYTNRFTFAKDTHVQWAECAIIDIDGEAVDCILLMTIEYGKDTTALLALYVVQNSRLVLKKQFFMWDDIQTALNANLAYDRKRCILYFKNSPLDPSLEWRFERPE